MVLIVAWLYLFFNFSTNLLQLYNDKESIGLLYKKTLYNNKLY